MSTVKTDPNATGSNEDTANEPSYVTREDIGNVVNSAVTSQLKRLNLSKQVTDALEASLAPFKEQFSSMSKSTPVAGSAAEVSSSSQDSTGALAAMQKKMDLLERTLKEKDMAIAAKERAVREKDAFGKVCHELTSLGVRAEGVEHLAKVLKSDGKIKVDEDGSVSFLLDDSDDVDLRTGLKSYLDPKANPAVALYLPPKALIKGGKAPMTDARGASVSSEVEAIKAIKDPAKRSAALIAFRNSLKK